MPAAVIEVICVCLTSSSNNGVGPDISDIRRLASVIPGLDLKEVGLEGENLRDSFREGELAASVPVLRWIDVFELKAGHR